MARPGLPARRETGYRRPVEACDVPGCDLPRYRPFHYTDDEGNPTSDTLGACTGHFRRIQRHGDPMPDVPIRERRHDV
jgi:hypothetical protein